MFIFLLAKYIYLPTIQRVFTQFPRVTVVYVQACVQSRKWAWLHFSPSSLLLWIWQQHYCGEGSVRVNGKKRVQRPFSQTLVFGGRWSALSLSHLAFRTAKQLLETICAQ